MVRLAFLLLSRRWGLLLVGVALVIGGLIWGFSGSHQVSYENASNAHYHIVRTTEDNIYFYTDNTTDYFIARDGDFNPAISDSAINASQTFDFTARTDTISVDADLNGTTISEAHVIEKLVLYDSNNQVAETYKTAEYLAHPTSFYESSWPEAIWLVILGALLFLVVLLLPLFVKKPQPATSFTIGEQGPTPGQPGQYQPYPPQPGQPGQYQPYPPQGATYPQPPQNNPYPPQSGQAPQ